MRRFWKSAIIQSIIGFALWPFDAIFKLVSIFWILAVFWAVCCIKQFQCIYREVFGNFILWVFCLGYMAFVLCPYLAVFKNCKKSAKNNSSTRLQLFYAYENINMCWCHCVYLFISFFFVLFCFVFFGVIKIVLVTNLIWGRVFVRVIMTNLLSELISGDKNGGLHFYRNFEIDERSKLVSTLKNYCSSFTACSLDPTKFLR